MKFYDSREKRLVFFNYEINSNFWDLHWTKYLTKKYHEEFNFSPKSLESKIVQKYIHPSYGVLLEGGCGIGTKMYNLDRLGYDIIGIDNAKSTVDWIKSHYPELKVKFGDIRKIPFPNNFFIGYLSLGVIEHFYETFIEAAKEMHRVIKSGGFLFLTFPYMSPFRRLKVLINLYRLYDQKQHDKENFYQYALNERSTIDQFNYLGFTLRYREPQGGIKGFKDEIFIFKFFLQNFLRLLNNCSKPKLLVNFKRFLDKILTLFSAHMILLIFQKE